MSDRTRLVFLTTGVLLRRLAADPELEGVTHVFVDEVHERTADADFLLVLLRRLLRDRAATTDALAGRADVAPSPRVVLMSATTDAARLSAYFDGTGAKHAPPPPHVHIPGRTYPVEERFVDQYVGGGRATAARTGGRATAASTGNRNGRENAADGVDYAALATVVRRLCEEASAKGDEGDGAVLVFLPGAPEIARAESELRSLRGASLVPLHGQLTPKEQQRAFAPPPAGARKIVLATNVAETSLTIPDVTYVVDTGRAKRLTHDPATRFSALREGWCSAASAAQRKGRAGRVRPGVCVRVYSRETAAAMAPMDPPELHTAPLESTVMHAMAVAPDVASRRDARARARSAAAGVRRRRRRATGGRRRGGGRRGWNTRAHAARVSPVAASRRTQAREDAGVRMRARVSPARTHRRRRHVLQAHVPRPEG